ncbi:dual specificity tyrosine-phosphorylation-regulated kinase mbk-1-like protein [Tanacetum coccineum]|uniref:Dual specificity tyrosine-phosphorylation-regulated kinase mbk-1-like protein n=1 Tax=Tanacetum coccineum TaxID=301880 RepID=A0ABQ5BCQ7_9ASTR
MEDSRVDVILDFLKRNNFARAEAALRSEIDKRPDLNGFMQNLNLQDNKVSNNNTSSEASVVGNQGKSASTTDEVSKEKHFVKELERRNGDDDNKWEIASLNGEGNSDPVGVKDKNFMFSNCSEDNLLDLYTWRYDPNSGSVDPSDNEDNIRTDNVKEYQISSQSKIHPSEAADTERVNRKVGEETDSLGEVKVSWLGPVSTSKANLAPKQLSLDKRIEPMEVNLQHPNKGALSKDEFLDNPWSRNDEFKSGSSELWNNNCSVKTVFPFSEGDASTSYSTSRGIGEKDDGKRKSDDIRAAIKEQENEVLKALYFGKNQGSIEPQAFGGLGLPVVPEHQKEELPRLAPVKLKSADKLSSMIWEEKHEHDGPGQNLNADNAYHIGAFLDVPIGQELNSTGLKRPVGGSWRSISQGITEDNSDHVSGFATVGDGSIDYPHEYWDSDEYDDDDDVGYMRQPIEDETWFLAHEIDYPSDNEKTTGHGNSPDPQERVPNKNEDDDQSFAEEDSYLSGDPTDMFAITNAHNLAVQYDGELLDEEELSLMSTEQWPGFGAQTNELVMFGEGKVVNEGGRPHLSELPMEDDQHASVRSIGVGMNSDATSKPEKDSKSAFISTKNVNDSGFSFPPTKDGKASSDNNLHALMGKDELLPPWRRKSNDSSPGSDHSGPLIPSDYGVVERAHLRKEDDEKVFEPTEEDPGVSLEDEEAVAVQEQVKQIKAQEEEYETFNLKIVHRKNRTGFEEDKNFHVVLNSVIAGRYHVTEYLGSAAFSKAIQAHDLHTGMDVCVKIIKNNKDFFDQSLDEIKLLKYVNKHDPGDKYHLLRLYDYFYYREHLLIVCELLKANLYEFHKFNRESGGEVYFTMPRLQSITIQCLEALKFLHGLGLIHCDLKPENILVKSYSRCEVKVIDLGSSCFETDHLCSYVQSRSYRAPEVILGLSYDKKIDIWSLGCILAELCTGNVLFQNDSPATLLARVIGIVCPIDQDMLAKGRDTHKYFTKNHMLYERNQDTNRLEYLIPKKTSLRHRLPMGDQGFIDFVSHLLEINPKKRPSAAEALKHPWLSYPYEPISS